MKITITMEREPLRGTATAEVHCSVKLGNGYVAHEQVLCPGQSGSLSFNVDEERSDSKSKLARSVTLEVTPIT